MRSARVMPGVDPDVRHHARDALLLLTISAVLAMLHGWWSVLDDSGLSFVIALVSFALTPFVALAVLAIVAVLVREGFRLARQNGLTTGDVRLARWSVPAAALLLVPTVAVGRDLAVDVRNLTILHRDRDAYQRIIRDVAAGVPAAAYRTGGRQIVYAVEPGTVPRVYFKLGGIGDNSTGFVFDPSDAVLAARGWDKDGQLTAPPTIREMFGGDLVRCTRVENHFHRCSLT